MIWNCNSDTCDQVLFLCASQEIPSQNNPTGPFAEIHARRQINNGHTKQ